MRRCVYDKAEGGALWDFTHCQEENAPLILNSDSYQLGGCLGGATQH